VYYVAREYMCALYYDEKLTFENVYLEARGGMCCVCCSVMQCVAVCCSALRCVEGVAVRCSVLQSKAHSGMCYSVLQCVTVCCSVLRCIAVCCGVLQCVAVCCSVLQCVIVCCSVLKWFAVCCKCLPDGAQRVTGAV